LTVHIYTTTFDDFVRKVQAYWDAFGLPIILSEFAMQVRLGPQTVYRVAYGQSFAPGVPPPSSQQQVHDFMGG
jgi:hypothetical protein